MNRRIVLRGLGLFTAWGSMGMLLSAESCEFEYERKQREAEMNRQYMEMWNRMRQQEMAAKQAAEEKKTTQAILESLKDYENQDLWRPGRTDDKGGFNDLKKP
ncbi:MAG TPA: hypothetical protein VMT54_20785 [Candidatus Cybelea sp.]|nr:hypothetical protein [Candidatus Cybelea sp.]